MFDKIIFFAVISTAYAAVYIDGQCPDVKPVDYLNLTAFTGATWYEIARYPNDIEKKGDCATVVFQHNSGDVDFTVTDVIDGKPNKIKGKISYAPNAGTSGILNYKAHEFEVSEATENILIYFVAVDYDSYCIGYECAYNKKTNKGHVYAWIKSRTKTLEGDAKVAVDKFLQTAPYIDTSMFYWDKFEDAVCNVKA